MSEVVVERERNRITVQFKTNDSLTYDRYVRTVKAIPGRSFSRAHSRWSVPLSMDTARQLRKNFKRKELIIGPRLREWAMAERGMEDNLSHFSQAHTAELERLPKVLPKLYEAIHLGPVGRNMTKKQRKKALKKPASYQAADVAFMAHSFAPINCSEMGLGKTIVYIASVFEAGLEQGVHLVVAPTIAIETVWERELDEWQNLPVLAATSTDRSEREALLAKAEKWARKGKAFWLVVNPEMIQYRKDPEHKATDYIHPARPKEYPEKGGNACDCRIRSKPHWHYYSHHPELHRIKFSTMCIDECHRSAICNTGSVTHASLKAVQTGKRTLQSGTPMGGKLLRLFGLLQFLRRDAWPSKWGYAGRFLTIEENHFGKHIVDELREGVEEDFNRALVPYMLRRTKAECLPWLPPKQYVNIWVDMTPGQRRQYEKFAADAEITIKKNRLVGKAVLDEYTRLRQFAVAKQKVVNGTLTPTTDSGKLAAMLQDLTELGIAGPHVDRGGDEQVVIFSQFTQVCDMIEGWLSSHDVDCAKITGKVKRKQRTILQDKFQAGQLRVLVMNVKAGGVAINLDRANTVMFVDETFDPDDQSQAEDRCHRASRIHQVTCRYYRSKGTVEELVFDTTTGKQSTNITVLDKSRKKKKK